MLQANMLANFIDQSLKLDDPDRLFQCYVGALGEYGVDRVMYSALRNTPYDEAIPSISHCYPEDWVKHYIAHDFMAFDPVRVYGATERFSFTWDEMMQVHELTSAERKIMDMGREAGLKSGLAVPLHGPLGEAYGVGMACSVNNPDIHMHLKDIHILSTQFHILYSGLHDKMRNARGVKLTPRELEVLKWCAAGKSNWSIGEILNISEHGVDFHMRNILRKLNADNRITAVVKALHGGVITF